MFKNISVRTFIMVFILAVFLIADVICLILSKNIFLLSLINIVWAAALAFLWIYMTKYLVTPINAVKRSIDEVNDGNLAVRIPIFGNNCAGRLIPGINNLSNNISTLVAEIRSSSDNAMSMSDQLANRSAELSVKTEQQSATLMQTAASMEQIAASTKNNAEHTRLASERAGEATQCARKGGALMGDVATNMQSITDCARQMTEIIAMIDGIAFQTNILALNAAVEAARAGDHGKGFSVVAGEVRNLAHRSAEAAKNIKTLINVTSENVTQGANIVAEAEKNMQEIVTGSGELSSLMEQIAVSTSEQEKGIDQITMALTELETVTQSNIGVVEELAGSSDVLKRQVIELQSRTQSFRIGNEAQTSVAPPASPPLQPAVAGNHDRNFWQSF
ncbi:methyl-accepting chemotaxis protein [Kluyvera genomosp. 1]|uniref:methyl-accepting chemotaxis protein n=1 Tax=Kluyvera genomosp. 1 TaxID=2774053 RepID=UPI00068E1AE0|nr:methyl-accepting chemotaxis protein [Kluyvera genomosp. 1]